MTREEYMKQKASELRNLAHSHSLEREMPSVPYFDNIETEEEWQKRINSEIKYWEDALKNSDTEGKKIAAKENLDRVKTSTYGKKLSGASCINTFTDNYSLDGNNRRISGTQSFAANPTKYGFSEITQSQLLPGDMVLDYSEGTPYHALMYDSTNDNGLSLYNYSRGGENKEDIVKLGKYKTLDKDAKFYTFVGTPEDLRKWSEEYIKLYIIPNMKMAGIDVKTSPDKLLDKIDLKSNGGNMRKKLIKKALIGTSLNDPFGKIKLLSKTHNNSFTQQGINNINGGINYSGIVGDTEYFVRLDNNGYTYNVTSGQNLLFEGENQNQIPDNVKNFLTNLSKNPNMVK